MNQNCNESCHYLKFKAALLKQINPNHTPKNIVFPLISLRDIIQLVIARPNSISFHIRMVLHRSTFQLTRIFKSKLLEFYLPPISYFQSFYNIALIFSVCVSSLCGLRIVGCRCCASRSGTISGAPRSGMVRRRIPRSRRVQVSRAFMADSFGTRTRSARTARARWKGNCNLNWGSGDSNRTCDYIGDCTGNCIGDRVGNCACLP